MFKKCSCGYELNVATPDFACPICGKVYGRPPLSEAQIEQLIGLRAAAARRSTLLPHRAGLAAWIVLFPLIAVFRPFFLGIIGRGPSWPVALQLLWMLAAIGTSVFSIRRSYLVAVFTYQGYTGTAFVEDRAAFGRAGGIDIMMWSPMLAWATVTAGYWIMKSFADDNSLWLIRNPWLFLVAIFVLSWVCANLFSKLIYPLTCQRPKRFINVR